MVSMKPTCRTPNRAGEPCGAPPLHGEAACFWHSEEHTAEAAQARRLGGMRRRREGALAGAYELDALRTTDDLRRLLEITAFDALGLENSVARVRALTAIVQVGVRLLEVAELEAALALIEATMRPRLRARRSA
jgi:hypothetical protein